MVTWVFGQGFVSVGLRRTGFRCPGFAIGIWGLFGFPWVRYLHGGFVTC